MRRFRDLFFRRRPSQQIRRYNRDTRQYERDEMRDFEEGADYLPVSASMRNSFETYDYQPRNRWENQYRDQGPYYESGYTPAVGYGYTRDEYYPMEPSRHSYRSGEAVGYGNYNSQQGRDFEEWLNSSRRNSNNRPPADDDYRGNVRTAHRRPDNRDFEYGLHPNEQPGRNRPENRGAGYDRYHDQYDRHPHMVVPREEEYYGRNNFNYSTGFGPNELVYPGEHRDDFGRWADNPNEDHWDR